MLIIYMYFTLRTKSPQYFPQKKPFPKTKRLFKNEKLSRRIFRKNPVRR
jgi:hypothetical protein